MATWSDFAAAQPRLAAAIRELVHQYGPGLGYLATVRADGGPRVHPVSPMITEEGLFCFVMDSPKRRDLERDGRYALHSFPPEENNDEAYLAGRARRITDATQVRDLARRVRAEPQVDWRLYEFSVEVAMLARHQRAPAAPAGYEVWLDPEVDRPGRGGTTTRG
jgi:Pyridoxamine 5'-phosphate oxidase